MAKINTRVIVDLNLTADDWQLYDKLDSDVIAGQLNQCIADAINNSMDQVDALRECDSILVKYAAWGAADSEGYAMLDRIMYKAFPTK